MPFSTGQPVSSTILGTPCCFQDGPLPPPPCTSLWWTCGTSRRLRRRPPLQCGCTSGALTRSFQPSIFQSHPLRSSSLFPLHTAPIPISEPSAHGRDISNKLVLDVACWVTYFGGFFFMIGSYGHCALNVHSVVFGCLVSLHSQKISAWVLGALFFLSQASKAPGFALGGF